MASIHKEIVIEVSVEQAWDAMRDVGALARRLARGFVTHAVMEEAFASSPSPAAWWCANRSSTSTTPPGAWPGPPRAAG
jgi:hypothetical protein